MRNWLRKSVTLRADLDQKVVLTDSQRRALARWTQDEGWEIYLNLFEGMCLESLGAVLTADSDSKRLEAIRDAKAFSRAWVEMQKRVLREIASVEPAIQKKPLTEEEEREQLIAAILDPVEESRQKLRTELEKV